MYLLESLWRGDSNKYTKRLILKKNLFKISVIYALDGSISSFFIKQTQFNSEIFGNKQCRYNEGHLYTERLNKSLTTDTVKLTIL